MISLGTIIHLQSLNGTGGPHELLSCHNFPSLREEFFDKDFVKYRVAVGAAVCNYGGLVVGVAGVEQSGENHSAGGDAEQHQRCDVARSQDHVEVRSGESADATFGDDHVAGLWSELRTDRAGCPLEELLALRRRLEGREQLVAAAHLG